MYILLQLALHFHLGCIVNLGHTLISFLLVTAFLITALFASKVFLLTIVICIGHNIIVILKAKFFIKTFILNSCHVRTCNCFFYCSKGQLRKLKLSGRNKYLYCTHVAEGHTNCVLSVCATDSLLFSASQG